MAKDDKKGSALVIGFGAPKKGSDSDMGMDMGMMAKEDAAQELMDAIKDGNAADVASAFQTMYDLCNENAEGEDEEY